MYKDGEKKPLEKRENSPLSPPPKNQTKFPFLFLLRRLHPPIQTPKLKPSVFAAATRRLKKTLSFLLASKSNLHSTREKGKKEGGIFVEHPQFRFPIFS